MLYLSFVETKYNCKLWQSLFKTLKTISQKLLVLLFWTASYYFSLFTIFQNRKERFENSIYTGFSSLRDRNGMCCFYTKLFGKGKNWRAKQRSWEEGGWMKRPETEYKSVIYFNCHYVWEIRQFKYSEKNKIKLKQMALSMCTATTSWLEPELMNVSAYVPAEHLHTFRKCSLLEQTGCDLVHWQCVQVRFHLTPNLLEQNK